MILKCNDCGHELTTNTMNSSTLTCSECGGGRSVKNPKEGVPGMNFVDSGTGKKRVL